MSATLRAYTYGQAIFSHTHLLDTKFHFLKIADELRENGFTIDCVDVLEKDVPVTKELLMKYNDMPYTSGEGVVINVDCSSVKERELTSPVWHYKSKSREYLMKMK